MAAAPNPIPELTTFKGLLSVALNAVRSGNYDDKLKEITDKLFKDRQMFRNWGNELGFARIHSIRWEVYDQRGLYDEALTGLKDVVKSEYLPHLKLAQCKMLPNSPNDALSAYKLKRQKVMCCLGYAFALYRTRQYDDAKDILNSCKSFIDNVLVSPNADPPVFCWGSLARYHYFYGQVLRSEQRFSLAAEQFLAALECARRRLDEKKAQGKSVERLHIEQLFANHCAAKVLAFGFGWSARLRGELSKAWEQLQAARLVLWESHDEFVKGQVDWLSCSVLRAQKGISLELQQLLPEIRECCKRLEKHTEYYLQACREHGIVLFNLALAHRGLNPDNCFVLLQEALKVVNEYGPQCRGNTRVLVLVLEARIRLAINGSVWSQECENLAREAYALSRALENKGIQGEATIALGEMLSAVPATRHDVSDRTDDPRQWTEAERCFLEIMSNRRDNILARCASYLGLAELELKRYRIVKAIDYLRLWQENAGHIEHTWFRQKAAEVKRKLDAQRVYLIDDSDKRKYDELSFELIKFLVDREEAKKPFNSKEAAHNIGVDVRTFQQWQEKIRKRETHRMQLHPNEDGESIP